MDMSKSASTRVTCMSISVNILYDYAYKCASTCTILYRNGCGYGNDRVCEYVYKCTNDCVCVRVSSVRDGKMVGSEG